MPKTQHFVNDGYGWACKRCRSAEDSRELTREAEALNDRRRFALPRFFREGEAEEREARLSHDALARWTDDTRRTLRCPCCGVEEEIND